MRLELAADQFDVFGGIEKAIRRTMKRHKSASRRYEIEQGFFLFRGDLRRIGINNEAIESRQACRVQVLHVLSVDGLDAFARENGLQLFEPIGGAVVAVVAEKKNPHGRGFGSEPNRCEKKVQAE